LQLSADDHAKVLKAPTFRKRILAIAGITNNGRAPQVPRRREHPPTPPDDRQSTRRPRLAAPQPRTLRFNEPPTRANPDPAGAQHQPQATTSPLSKIRDLSLRSQPFGFLISYLPDNELPSFVMDCVDALNNVLTNADPDFHRFGVPTSRLPEDQARKLAHFLDFIASPPFFQGPPPPDFSSSLNLFDEMLRTKVPYRQGTQATPQGNSSPSFVLFNAATEPPAFGLTVPEHTIDQLHNNPQVLDSMRRVNEATDPKHRATAIGNLAFQARHVISLNMNPTQENGKGKGAAGVRLRVLANMSERVQKEMPPGATPINEDLLRAMLNGAFSTSASYDKFDAAYSPRIKNWSSQFRDICTTYPHRFIDAVAKFNAALLGAWESRRLETQLRELLDYFTRDYRLIPGRQSFGSSQHIQTMEAIGKILSEWHAAWREAPSAATPDLGVSLHTLKAPAKDPLRAQLEHLEVQELVDNSVATGRLPGAPRPSTNSGLGTNSGIPNAGARNGGPDFMSINLNAPPTSSIPDDSKRPPTDFTKNSPALSTFTSAMAPYSAATTPCARWCLALGGCTNKHCPRPHQFPAKFDPDILNRATNLLLTPLPPGFALKPEETA